LVPSGATISGFWRTSADRSRLPFEPNRIGVPPAEEKYSSAAGLVPYAGVSW
jgi:hypothetical protein